MRLNESVAEAALKPVQSFVEGVRDIVHDYQQFCQHPGKLVYQTLFFQLNSLQDIELVDSHCLLLKLLES